LKKRRNRDTCAQAVLERLRLAAWWNGRHSRLKILVAVFASVLKLQENLPETTSFSLSHVARKYQAISMAAKHCRQLRATWLQHASGGKLPEMRSAFSRCHCLTAIVTAIDAHELGKWQARRAAAGDRKDHSAGLRIPWLSAGNIWSR
jgi:hypothetical protein